MTQATESNTTNRRSFLVGAAVAALAVPTASIANDDADPIYAAIQDHRDACAFHCAAVDIEWALEEQLKLPTIDDTTYDLEVLRTASTKAFWRLENAGVTLLNTKPTTFAGLIALCRYVEPLFNEPSTPHLPVDLTCEDDTTSSAVSVFVGIIAAAVESQLQRTA
jgi:hypothetical protein